MFQNTKESKTKLSELGEFGLIDHLTQFLKLSKPQLLLVSVMMQQF